MCGTWRAYIRQPRARRPGTHGKHLLTLVRSTAHNHKYTVGQRIVRSLIRVDLLIIYYRTGRFHGLNH